VLPLRIGGRNVLNLLRKEKFGGGGARKQELAAWKHIQSHDVTKTYPADESLEWKYCTKCKCKVTGKQGFFQLSYFDADHQDNYRPPAAFLSHVGDPNAGVPTGPPLVTTKEPDETEIDEDEIVFQDCAWCCVVSNAPDSHTTYTHVVSTEDSEDEGEGPPAMSCPKVVDDVDSDDESRAANADEEFVSSSENENPEENNEHVP
jgi:hypothetical protein